MKTRVFVALGSNVGDRHANIARALRRLEPLAVGPVVCSSRYETAAEGIAGAADFINAVAMFETERSPRDLLAALQQVEVDMGRPADHARNTSRTIDLDIVAFGDRVIDEPGIVVPHPRARQRDFVMKPLLEIAPDFSFPDNSVRLSP